MLFTTLLIAAILVAAHNVLAPYLSG